MAKSLRAKTKRLHRARKRTEGVYAATEAARLHRLHSKLKAVTDSAVPEREDEDEDELVEGEERTESGAAAAADGQTSTDGANAPDAMDTDPTASSSTARISTHGPRNSRREQWRASKGLVPRPKAKGNGMNRQGGIAARRKAGRSLRRR